MFLCLTGYLELKSQENWDFWKEELLIDGHTISIWLQLNEKGNNLMSASGTFLPQHLVKEMPAPVSLNTRGWSSSSGQWHWELGEASKEVHYFIHFQGSKWAPLWLASSGKNKIPRRGVGTWASSRHFQQTSGHQGQLRDLLLSHWALLSPNCGL